MVNNIVCLFCPPFCFIFSSFSLKSALSNCKAVFMKALIVSQKLHEKSGLPFIRLFDADFLPCAAFFG